MIPAKADLPPMLLVELLATTTRLSVQFCLVLETSLNAAAISVWRGPKLMVERADCL